MTDLVVLGTGVHAVEMAYIVERVNHCRPTWNLLGYIAPWPGEWPDGLAGQPVLGTIETLSDHPGAAIVADNEFPKDIEIPADRLITLIDPSTSVHPAATLGRGCVVYGNGFVGYNATLGERVFVLSGATINHDDVIGDRTILAAGATLAGLVTVEKDCYLGQSCTIRQSVRVGRNSLVGMGSVVVKDVEPNSVVAGNPARRLRTR